MDSSRHDSAERDCLKYASEKHKEELIAHGFEILKQQNLDNYLFRNSPWKTYWKVKAKDESIGFVKVNYGYPTPRVNEIIGKKEALLSEYFSEKLQGEMSLAAPRIIKHWYSKSGYFCVFKWQDLEGQSLQSCLADPNLLEKLVTLLKNLNEIHPPGWWCSDYEVHNFAGKGINLTHPIDMAPFGFDLDDNLAVISDGRLYFYDFEFIQWTPKGLQETYLALKTLFTSRRSLFSFFAKDNPAKVMLRHINGKSNTDLINQASSALWQKLLRNKKNTIYAWLKIKVCKLLI
jgi:hypothetical protein